MTEQEVQKMIDSITEEAIRNEVGYSELRNGGWIEEAVARYQRKKGLQVQFDEDFKRRLSGSFRSSLPSKTEVRSEPFIEDWEAEGFFSPEGCAAFKRAMANGQIRIFDPSKRQRR